MESNLFSAWLPPGLRTESHPLLNSHPLTSSLSLLFCGSGRQDHAAPTSRWHLSLAGGRSHLESVASRLHGESVAAWLCWQFRWGCQAAWSSSSWWHSEHALWVPSRTLSFRGRTLSWACRTAPDTWCFLRRFAAVKPHLGTALCVSWPPFPYRRDLGVYCALGLDSVNHTLE